MIAKLVIIEDLPIIISEEDIEDVRDYMGCWILEKNTIINKLPDYLTDLSDCELIIAGFANLPVIDWNGLEGEFGYVHWSKHWEKVNLDFKEGVNPHAYRRGFKDAQALNEKNYTLEDIKKAFYQGWATGLYLADDNEGEGELDKIIHTLSQPKIFPIEIELNLPIDNANERIQNGESPVTVMKKLTSNSVKILRRV